MLVLISASDFTAPPASCRKSPGLLYSESGEEVTLLPMVRMKKKPRTDKTVAGLLCCGMGLGRVELPTSRLSGVRSNHLSYRPGRRKPVAMRPAFVFGNQGCAVCVVRLLSSFSLATYSVLEKGGDPAAGSPTATLLRLRPSHRACLRPLPPCG